MKNLADLLNVLAKTAGISEDNEEFKALIQIKELATTNVPEDLAKSFTDSLEGGLLSIDAAKNNKEIKDHFTALALNGVDTEIEKVIADMDLDEETKTLLKNTDSTYKKVSLIPTRLKAKYEALIEEAKKDNGGEDTEKLTAANTTISELNKELSTIKENTVGKELHDTAIANHAAQLMDLNIKTLLGGKKLTSTLPRNVAIAAAKNVFDEALKEKGISLDASDGLKLKSADGSQDYYDKNNQPVTVDAFIDTLLADNKLLDVSPPGPPSPTPTPTPGPTDGPIPPPTSETDVFDQHALDVEQQLQPQT